MMRLRRWLAAALVAMAFAAGLAADDQADASTRVVYYQNIRWPRSDANGYVRSQWVGVTLTNVVASPAGYRAGSRAIVAANCVITHPHWFACRVWRHASNGRVVPAGHAPVRLAVVVVGRH